MTQFFPILHLQKLSQLKIVERSMKILFLTWENEKKTTFHFRDMSPNFELLF